MSRTARISARVLKWMGAGFVLSVLAFFATQLLGIFYLRNWCLLAAAIFSAVALLAAVARMIMAIFAESQYRISEVVITFFVAGTFAAIATAIVAPRLPDFCRDSISVVIVLTIFGLIGTGSVWAWSAASSLAVYEAWPRLKFLMAGWAVVPGLFMLFFFSLLFIITLINGESEAAIAFFVVSIFAVPFYLPGIRIELRRRKAARVRTGSEICTQPLAQVAQVEGLEKEQP